MGNYKTKEEYLQSFANNEVNKNSIFGGKFGLGDPEDKYLYMKEVKFGLPAKRKEILLSENCFQSNQVVAACEKQHGVLKRFRCKNEMNARNQCLRQFWDTPGLEERTYNEYLATRRRYRETGVSQKESKWTNSKQKSWEEYQEDQKKSLLQLILKTFRTNEHPDISVHVESERLKDS